MSEEDDSQKTEDPTTKKLSKAREKGQVAQSQEVKTWGMLLGIAFIIYAMAPMAMVRIKDVTISFLSSPHSFSTGFEDLRWIMADLVWEIFLILFPIFGLLIFIGLVVNLVQVGLLWAPPKIKPEWSKISIIKGAKRLMGAKQLVEFAKGLFKIAIVTVISFGLVIPMLKDILLVPDMDILATLEKLWEIVIWFIIGAVGVMSAMAGLDYLYQRYTFTKQMRMTKQEVKDEHKQAEGDPQIKAKIHSLRIQRARRRMMSAVPQADVVVTNPTHYAVALEYKMEAMGAPRLLAKGVDAVAWRIREVAEDHDIPIVENPPLARALYATVELEEEIPPEHYKAVAEVIGYVMRLRGQMQQQDRAS